MIRKHLNGEKGFTLPELLVVIAIIIVLSTIILASLTSARAKARDARRLSDMRQIQNALELYRVKYATYPAAPSTYGENTASDSTWDNSAVDQDGDGIFFLDPLVEQGFLPQSIVDPINSGNNTYSYYGFSAGISGCTRPFYVLRIKAFETYPNPHPQSPVLAAGSNNGSTVSSCLGAFVMINGWVVYKEY